MVVGPSGLNLESSRICELTPAVENGCQEISRSANDLEPSGVVQVLKRWFVGQTTTTGDLCIPTALGARKDVGGKPRLKELVVSRFVVAGFGQFGDFTLK